MRVYLSDDNAECDKGDKEEWEEGERGNRRTDRMVEDSDMLYIG
jgi:hypothetical protein